MLKLGNAARIGMTQVISHFEFHHYFSFGSGLRLTFFNFLDMRITFEDFVPIYQQVNKNRENHTLEEFVDGLAHFDKEVVIVTAVSSRYSNLNF